MTSGGIKRQMARLADGFDLDSNPPPNAPSQPMRRATTAPGLLAQHDQQYHALQERLRKLQEGAGAPVELLIDEIEPSPYQTRLLDEAQVTELVDNLRFNALTSPIVVRKRPEGGHELIAGHHRVEAYKRLREKGGPGSERFDRIKATVVEMADEVAVRAVFFDNLLAPQISDFDRYLGFDLLKRSSSRDLSLKELAEQAGISPSQMSRYFAFGKLGEPCLAVLREHRKVLGAAAASRLGDLPDEAKARLPEGIRLLADGKLTQAQLLKWATGSLPSESESETKPVMIKRGREMFAKVTRKGERFLIEFQQASDATAFEAAVLQALESLKKA